MPACLMRGKASQVVAQVLTLVGLHWIDAPSEPVGMHRRHLVENSERRLNGAYEEAEFRFLVWLAVVVRLCVKINTGGEISPPDISQTTTFATSYLRATMALQGLLRMPNRIPYFQQSIPA